jgi:hypothetical protein
VRPAGAGLQGGREREKKNFFFLFSFLFYFQLSLFLTVTSSSSTRVVRVGSPRARAGSPRDLPPAHACRSCPGPVAGWRRRLAQRKGELTREGANCDESLRAQNEAGRHPHSLSLSFRTCPAPAGVLSPSPWAGGPHALPPYVPACKALGGSTRACAERERESWRRAERRAEPIGSA